MELGEWAPYQTTQKASWAGSDLAAPRHGTSTRSDCRKALLFDGGTMRRPHFSYPKKHPAGFFSLLSFFLDRILSLTYPLYSATVDRPATQQAPNDTITRSLSEIRGSSISWQPSHRTRYSDTSTAPPHAPGHPCSSTTRYIPSRDGWTSPASSYRPRPQCIPPVSTRPSHPCGLQHIVQPPGHPIVTSGLISADFRGDV